MQATMQTTKSRQAYVIIAHLSLAVGLMIRCDLYLWLPLMTDDRDDFTD